MRGIRIPMEFLREIEARWEKARDFFSERRPVVFFSSERFWETHGFVQQSLAIILPQLFQRTVLPFSFLALALSLHIPLLS